MSARLSPRREIPDRVRADLERRESGAAGPHRGCRVPRPTERRRAIAASMAGE